MSQSVANLVEERVSQLQEIRKRRSALLREMYHLIQKRDNLGSMIALDEDVEENLQLFLDRFDLEKHPDTGHIENLQDEEVALPVTPPAYSPVTGPQLSQRSPSNERVDSPGSPSPGSPPPADDVVPEEAQVAQPTQQQTDVDMDVDEAHAGGQSPPPEMSEIQCEEASRTASQEPFTVHDVKVSRDSSNSVAELSQPKDETEPTQPPATSTNSQLLVDTSLESPMPRSVDHSSAVSYTDASATREPSSARASPPRSQRSPSSIAQPSSAEESAIKSEPLDDEPMEMADSPVATQKPLSERPESPEMHELALQHSEDHIMEILKPSQEIASPVWESAEYRHSVDYSIPRPSVESLDGSFAFDGGVALGLEDVDVTPVEPFGPDPPYALPRLSLLPIEFSRRGKSTKRERKKDKERDKGEAKKEEWAPMSLNKWAAVLRANPVHKKLSRASKCLSTRDWSVGMTEVRLIRTFERIELLKNAGSWSFRQIKKQRGVGGLMKTHWDYLMDEMKWMRTDFREERRWKLALAYTLAHAVMEWHGAGTIEERVRRGICVLWKPPPPEDVETAEASEVEGPFRDSQEGDDTGVDSRETATPLNDYGSDDDSEDEQDKEQQDVIDALEPGAALQDALEQLEEHAQSRVQDAVALKPKMEEVEDMTALDDGSQSQDKNAMDVDVPEPEPAVANLAAPKGEKPKVAETASHPGLKTTSKNPILSKPSVDGEGTHGKSKTKASHYAPLRDHIVYSNIDKLFVDLDDLDIVKGMSELSTEDFSPTAPPPPADLTSIFPDLQPYGMFDLAPAPPTGQDGRKKSDRRGDKDDPNKRAEDVTYSKLVPTSKFMQIKPTLVGALNPASNWHDGKWKRIEETPIFADVDVPPARTIEENLCALFEGGKASGSGSHQAGPPGIGRDGRKRTADVVWTPADDSLLKHMVEKYPANWSLVAEAFNSSRVTISTDKRTAFDCWDRWMGLVNGSANGGEDERRTATPAAASSHMTTRKRTASQSVAAVSGNSSNGASQSTEPKKRVRHHLMHDTLRKAAKRREAVQKSNAAPRPKATAVHETHGQVTKMNRYTPAELSRMKADKEARDAQELLVRRRNDEINRQHLLREQVQRAQGLPPNAQQPQTPQPPPIPQNSAVNGVPRPAAGVPQPQIVQQIRSQVGISQQQQQQRIAAALAAGATSRMSPPQLTAAQAAHFRAMTAVQGQAQASGQAVGQPNSQGTAQLPQSSAAAAAAAPALSATHLSPPFAARATSSSPGIPQQSPPLPAASPANVAVARPPSVAGQPVQGVAMNPMLHAQNVAQYYMQMQQRGLTPDQLQVMVAQVRPAQRDGARTRGAERRPHQIQAQQQQRQAQQQAAAHQQYAAAAAAAHAQQQPAQQGQNPQGGGGYQHA
ncbi:hypothetical protein BC628DRAFT_1354063 [Trametes gibbosa]|nr:hypothetical protein BC628DRAFT_1354063 [Trametes gibbosa]